VLTKAIFDQFRLTNLERSLGVFGIHVYQAGEGDVELRFRADDAVHVWSASKTFTSAALGMCLGEGRLQLTDKVLNFFSDYADIASPGSELISLHDLLQMRCGKDFDFFEVTDKDVINATDWAELFLRGQTTSTPGSRFYYANVATYMIGRVIEAVTGLTTRNYLMPRLFDPLHILNPAWNTCPGGHSISAWGLQLVTSDLAKMGRLLLQGGRWDDAQLIPNEYVEAMHTDVVDSSNHFPDEESCAGYGYQIWLCTSPGTWRLDGLYGQFSIIIPDKQAVVTTTSHNEKAANDIIRAVFTDIEPKL